MRRLAATVLAIMLLLGSSQGAAAHEPGCRYDPFPRARNVRALGWSPDGLRRVEAEVGDIGSASFMIITDAKTVLSVGDTARNFETHSIRKSLVSALFGIAIGEGKINPEETLRDLQIDDSIGLTPLELDTRVIDILAARSGVYIPAAAETPRARAERPARGSHAPGSFWYYNNWDFNVAGEVYQRKVGRPVFTAFDHLIARPLCMQDFDPHESHLNYEPAFSRFPAYYFRISARDLARFGQLYLDGGRWRGNQVVPAEWVQKSTSAVSISGSQPGSTRSGYGYMWWVNARAARDGEANLPVGSFTASGWHGHRMTVIPALRTIIVNRMNTDDPTAPFFEDGLVYERLLTTILNARLSSSQK